MAKLSTDEFRALQDIIDAINTQLNNLQSWIDLWGDSDG